MCSVLSSIIIFYYHCSFPMDLKYFQGFHAQEAWDGWKEEVMEKEAKVTSNSLLVVFMIFIYAALLFDQFIFFDVWFIDICSIQFVILNLDSVVYYDVRIRTFVEN
jgi:hypothetical protein